MLEVRTATHQDIPELMEIFRKARGIMRSSGNLHQWNESYPSEEIIKNDIDSGNSIVLCCDGRIIATMAFIPGPDPTYARIYEGEWPNELPYHVIHRIAVNAPGQGVAVKLLDWAFCKIGKGPAAIRIDTHKDNVIMQHILKKYGFTYCGIIHLANGDPRDAYIKTQA